jgi:peptidoglycan/xylan/chitin deacetylase (PgdA/CDA1 family)
MAAKTAPTKLGKRQRAARYADRAGLLPIVSRVRSVFARDLRILAYHRVLPLDDLDTYEFDPDLVSASAAAFRRQMRFVADRFRPLSFRELAARLDRGLGIERDSIIVTFDDGYEDNYSVAFPILRECGVPATFFLATGHVDRGSPYRYDWLAHALLSGNGYLRVAEIGLECALPQTRTQRVALVTTMLHRIKALSQSDQDVVIERSCAELGLPIPAQHPHCRPMQWHQAREMAQAGMEIGSHGVTHRMLAKLDHADIVRELVESKASIERETGTAVCVVSYPVGGNDAFDRRVIEAAQSAGYRYACSYISGTNSPRTWNTYALRRLAVEWYTDDAAFRALLALPELFSYATPDRRRRMR